MSDFDEAVNKRYKKRLRRRSLFILAMLAVVVPIVLAGVSWVREGERQRPAPPIPQKPIDPPVLPQPFNDFEEVFFHVGHSHIEEDYVNKVLSMLKRISLRNNATDKDQCQVFIICSGDSRGDFELTKYISDQRACEIKSHIAERVDRDNGDRWGRAKLWSFGTIITPGLKRPGLGEDFNCGCTVIATTDQASVEQRYQNKLEVARRERSGHAVGDLKDYEVSCSLYHHSH